jgi:hypothetical protein
MSAKPLHTLERDLFAGALTGAFTKTAVAPLERAKVLLQLQVMTTTPNGYRGVVDALRQIYLTEGVRGFYRGNGANVLRVLPVHGLKFGLNDYFKHLIAPGEVQPSTLQLMGVRFGGGDGTGWVGFEVCGGGWFLLVGWRAGGSHSAMHDASFGKHEDASDHWQGPEPAHGVQWTHGVHEGYLQKGRRSCLVSMIF